MAEINYEKNQGGKPSSIELSKPLTGLTYPVDRDHVIEYARQHDASDRAVDTLQEIEDRKFSDLNDILQSVNL